MDNSKTHLKNSRKEDTHIPETYDDKDLIQINVRGAVFLTTRETILCIPDSRLAIALTSKESYNDKLDAYFFNRRSDLFNIVLQAHSEGEVHIPSEACANEVLNELEYWNISKSLISPCCIGKCTAAIAERNIALTVREQILGDFEKSVRCLEESRGWKRTATKLWIFLEFPVSSMKAKCWSVFIATMVIMWTLFLMLTCDVNFRDPIQINYTRDELNGVETIFQSDKWLRLWLSPYLDNVYIIVDIIVTLIILFDIILRIVACPYRIVFLKTAKVIPVVLVFLSVFIQMISLPILLAKVEMTSNLRYFFLPYTMLGNLRPFLLIRLADAFVGLRVLIIVITKSMAELLTIVSFMLCGVLFFGVFIWLAEINVDGSFMSPWEGCWWSLITMTTVGYGDMYPHGWPGYFVGTICTFCGIIITGLSIPILSSNFSSYYNHVHMAIAEIRDYMENNKL